LARLLLPGAPRLPGDPRLCPRVCPDVRYVTFARLVLAGKTSLNARLSGRRPDRFRGGTPGNGVHVDCRPCAGLTSTPVRDHSLIRRTALERARAGLNAPDRRTPNSRSSFTPPTTASFALSDHMNVTSAPEPSACTWAGRAAARSAPAARAPQPCCWPPGCQASRLTRRCCPGDGPGHAADPSRAAGGHPDGEAFWARIDAAPCLTGPRTAMRASAGRRRTARPATGDHPGDPPGVQAAGIARPDGRPFPLRELRHT
jgi:hypothetical protein